MSTTNQRFGKNAKTLPISIKAGLPPYKVARGVADRRPAVHYWPLEACSCILHIQSGYNQHSSVVRYGLYELPARAVRDVGAGYALNLHSGPIELAPHRCGARNAAAMNF